MQINEKLQSIKQSKERLQEILGRGIEKTSMQELVEGYENYVAVHSVCSDLYVEITYNELKALQDSSSLVPGTFYRITDYVTTTTQKNTQSTGHAFDIIVTADTENTLNSAAKAVKHEGDTYFGSCDLSKWELKYDINNDIGRYEWADSTNGKGVIYYMKDEFENECPYDFKNILFKRWKISASTTTPDLVGKYLAFGTSASGYTVNTSDYKMCYTFNYIDNNTCLDVSLNNPEVVDIVSGASKPISNNVINSWYNMSTLKLNNIVFNAQTFSLGSTHKYFFWDNKIKNNCHDMSFDSGCHTNTFGNSCYDNTFGDSCQSNTFGNNCNYNTFGDNCESNTFGDNCTYNAFGKSGQNNIFGGSCQYNTLGNYCDNNKFGNTISYVTFGLRTTKDELNPQTFNYYNNIIVESNNRYINITGDNTTPSSSNLLKNIVIKSDVKTNNESSTDILNLIFSRNCDYEQTVSKNSSGEIITYSLPDLATSVQNIQLQLLEIESLTDDILS